MGRYFNTTRRPVPITAGDKTFTIGPKAVVEFSQGEDTSPAVRDALYTGVLVRLPEEPDVVVISTPAVVEIAVVSGAALSFEEAPRSEEVPTEGGEVPSPEVTDAPSSGFKRRR